MSDWHPAGIQGDAGAPARRGGDSLADVLERVLDKGIVVAGDIRIDLLDIELLTIRIRLLISSADKAAELGMAWWQQDPWYSGLPEEDRSGRDDFDERLDELLDHNKRLAQRMTDLESGLRREHEPGTPESVRKSDRQGGGEQ